MNKKEQIATIFEEIAVLLELKGENPFKSRAYSSAARTLNSLNDDLDMLIAEDRLGDIKGIGEGLREKITEFCTTGKLKYYEKLKASIPAELLNLLEIPGLGPKKAKALYEKLKIKDLAALEKACRAHKVARLAGFGEKTEENILAGIEQRRSYEAQFRYGEILPLAGQILAALRDHPDVVRCSLGGSLRRGRETVKDIDLLASSKKPKNVMEMFVKLPGVIRVTGHGETKSSVVFEGGVRCDLRVVTDREYPYALHHFTGSKEHNVAMRQRAISQKKKLSEWGLFREPGDKLIECRTEEEIFDDLGLQYIPPELRENMGEIEAAEKKEIPKLVEWTQLRGTFHCHTNASDGKNNLAQMAGAAQGLGLEYLGIADHSKSSFQANGLSEERLRKQIEQIAQLNKSLKDIYVFSGCEVDILKDGKLDYDDKLLRELDYVVASVHNVLNQPEDVMTRRVIRAMENKYVTMLGHATGRLLLERPASAINLGKIIDCAAATGTWIELNANTWRLDMDWRWWHRARDKGVKCVINPDAHSIGQFDCLPIGVTMARKGWLRKEDVVNTLPLAQIKKSLTEKRAR